MPMRPGVAALGDRSVVRRSPRRRDFRRTPTPPTRRRPQLQPLKPMPDHPQHKLSPLILIGFAALLGLLAPACVGSARIAELVNQRVSDEGMVRFEIDIHRSIFEREMFRLCHAPQGSSKYRCVPLAKSVEDGRFILTVDGKRHGVRGIAWASCILHESSRHCEKIDIAPTRERLSELKRAEQQRIAQEAEAKRLESLRAQEAA